MRRVVCYRTSDGVLHESELAARHHADKRYGDLLTSLVHRALRADKYMPMIVFFERHLDEMCTLRELGKDMDLEKDDEDD